MVFSKGFSAESALERAKKLAREADNECYKLHDKDADYLLRCQTKAMTATALATVAMAVRQEDDGDR